MSEFIDKRTVVQNVPVARRTVVETRRGTSGVAVTGLFVAAITAAVIMTTLIVNSQQRNSNEALAQERARTAAAQQALVQPAQQPPVIVNMQPAPLPTLAIPYPVPGPSPAPIFARTAPSNASVEIDVTSRLQTDELLRPYAVNVKVSGGVATLSGKVPDEDLKKRAEKLALNVNAVHSVVNDIDVRP